MALKIKLYLTDKNDSAFFGQGRYRLLREIGRRGSLQKAAEELGISYRKAWADIRSVEQRLGFELLTRRRGGPGGGSSVLTERAERLLAEFETANTKLQAAADELCKGQLGGLLESP